MERYIALLRAINVSGKNKIAMSELKTAFGEIGYAEVFTHLNSGNVIFSSNVDDTAVLASTIKSMIKNKFELDIPVFIILQKQLEDILNNAPAWWGSDNKDIYDNLIFMFPPLSYDEFYNKVGSPKAEYEKACNYKNAVFWSFIRKDYQKTNWWSKTARSNITDKITVRTANTARKIVVM